MGYGGWGNLVRSESHSTQSLIINGSVTHLRQEKALKYM